MNLGPWRLRNYSTYSHSDNSSRWESVYSYLARDIHTLRSQLVVGNTYTSSGIFDSVSFTGLQLSSDKEMLPDSLHGFAPTIRGIARAPPRRSRFIRMVTAFIKPPSLPAPLRLTICMPPAAPAICTSPLKSLTAASKTLWCLLPRWRSCSARANWTMR